MTEVKSWNQWATEINSSSREAINHEIATMENNTEVPFVEKNLKLGYLYFANDQLGKATNLFHNIAAVISKEIKNTMFRKENEKGLNILREEWECVPIPGGFRIGPSGGEFSGFCNFCCCFAGVAVIMGVFGISVNDITTCDTTDGQGCLDNCLEGCCNFFGICN